MAGKKTAGWKKVGKQAKRPRLSRARKPEDLSLEEWQIGLRRQIATEQKFKIRNIGHEPIFSEFEVTNPQTRRAYRVAIRGDGLGVNYCSCPDFAVNTLGTCKHVEYTLGRLRRQRGGKRALAEGFQPAYSEVYLRYGSRRDVIFRAGSECPDSIRRFAGRFFDDDGVLRPDAVPCFHEFLARAAGNGHQVRCYDDALTFISQARDRLELIKRIDAAFPAGADDPAFDRLLRVKLYPYQRAGALFAARAGRCLLADDMGLGKTAQAIAAAEILMRHGAVERVLVVCPTSLKHQWQQEIERFTGRTAVVVEGMGAARRHSYAADADYRIVNYDVVYRDLPEIGKHQTDLIILDEAQRIKNWQTRTAKTIKQLQSDHAFVLTGTPLENRLEELHSIVEFVDRYRLGPMFRFLAEHQETDETGRVVGYRNLDRVSTTLSPLLVRRTKQAVLKQLPERLEKRYFVPMTEPQMRYHEENRETVARIVRKWRRFGYLSELDQKILMAGLQNMRMSCDSTYLLDGETDHGLKADEVLTLLEEVFEDRDAKVVIFSQWLRMHELLARRIEQRKWPYVMFHGGVPGPKRKELVRRFQEEDNCRLFLSTDAGGVGLNLQSASMVANMDLPWNPAVLEQRIGRVHRLGQHRPVRVAHFIAAGTIEEGMLNLLAFKKSVFAGVLDGGSSEVYLGGTRLKQFMKSVETATGGSHDGETAEPRNRGAGDPRDGEAVRPAAGAGGRDSGTVGQAAAPAEADRRAGDRVPGEAPADRSGAAPGSGAALPPQALGDLLTVGASLLGELGKALSEQGGDPTRLISRDEKTGRQYLQLPLPKGAPAEQMAGLLESLAGALRGR